MLEDSEDMSKVRCTCLSRSMPRIAPVFNGAHSNFVVRFSGLIVPLWVGFHSKQNIRLLHQLDKF